MLALAELTLEIWLRHPHEDVLEKYALHRLAEPDVESVEEHLLICEPCQQKLLELDEFILAMKSVEPAPAHAAAPAPSRESSWSRWWNAPRGWSTAMPGRAALAGAMALICAAGIAVHWQSSGGSPVTVTLKSMRGGDPGYSAAAPARHPLALAIDVPDVSSCAQCRVEIVNSSGRRMWSGSAAIQEGQLCVATPVVLDPGAYWVRLYSAGNGGKEPDREFGLRIQ